VSCLLLFFALECYRASILTLLQHLFVCQQHIYQYLCILVVAKGSNLLILLKLRLNGLKVFKLKFGIDDALVFDRIYSHTAFANDVVVFEATDYMDYSVTLTDVTKEFVAKTFALACALYQSGNVYNLASSRNNTSRMYYLCELCQSLVRNGDNAKVWLDSTERKVGSLCFSTRQAVEKSRLTYVRQTYYTTF